jgi:cell division septation protein DedD
MSVGSDFGKTKKASSISRVKIFFLLLCIILFVISVRSYVKQHHSKKLLPAKHVQLQSLPVKLAIKPEYDFYQMLPKVQVTPTSQPIPLDTAADVDRQYWVQVAASSSLPDIQRRLKELQAAGYIAIVKKSASNKQLYRIVLGPYAQSGIANVVLKRLRVSGDNGYIFSQEAAKS